MGSEALRRGKEPVSKPYLWGVNPRNRESHAMVTSACREQTLAECFYVCKVTENGVPPTGIPFSRVTLLS